MKDYLYLDDITGTIGEWFKMDISCVPAEVIEHLKLAYKLCAESLEKEGVYTCEFCGFSEGWEETDTVHGDMWSCEVCGKIFCSKCFKNACGDEKYNEMMQSGEYVRCPQCFEKAEGDVKR